jgi:hypothetical protein
MDELPMVRMIFKNDRGEEADDRFTLLLMLDIYVSIPYLASNLGLESGDRWRCWHSISLLPSRSKSQIRYSSLFDPLLRNTSVSHTVEGLVERPRFRFTRSR